MKIKHLSAIFFIGGPSPPDFILEHGRGILFSDTTGAITSNTPCTRWHLPALDPRIRKLMLGFSVSKRGTLPSKILFQGEESHWNLDIKKMPSQGSGLIWQLPAVQKHRKTWRSCIWTGTGLWEPLLSVPSPLRALMPSFDWKVCWDNKVSKRREASVWKMRAVGATRSKWIVCSIRGIKRCPSRLKLFLARENKPERWLDEDDRAARIKWAKSETRADAGKTSRLAASCPGCMSAWYCRVARGRSMLHKAEAALAAACISKV